jgi:hypothetical protein
VKVRFLGTGWINSPTDSHPVMDSRKSPQSVFTMYASGRGPRLCLALAFVLLLSGYLGAKLYSMLQKIIQDPSETGHRSPLALILFELFSGIGSNACYPAMLDTVVRSFPGKIR